MSTYDPGEPYDGPPPRRRRRRDYQRDSEYDDAWAAASEDAVDGDLAVEELAAGYAWEDRDRYGVHRDEPGGDRARYPDASSPTYHRDRARRSEYAEYYDSVRAPRRGQPPAYRKAAVPRQGVPYWHILILVVLVLVATLAVTLACVSLLTLA